MSRNVDLDLGRATAVGKGSGLYGCNGVLYRVGFGRGYHVISFGLNQVFSLSGCVHTDIQLSFPLPLLELDLQVLLQPLELIAKHLPAPPALEIPLQIAFLLGISSRIV